VEDTATVLRQARARAGLTQAQLARRTGVPASVLSAYENARREPSARTFRSLLHACGVELTTVDRWDNARNGRLFELVMEMTDQLPQGERGQLDFPSFRRAADA
jgi:transcriptional regulator with XRE-family HTH domain